MMLHFQEHITAYQQTECFLHGNHGKCPGGFHTNIFVVGEGCAGLVSLWLPYREELLMQDVLVCKQCIVQWWKSSLKKHFVAVYSVGVVHDPLSKE